MPFLTRLVKQNYHGCSATERAFYYSKVSWDSICNTSVVGAKEMVVLCLLCLKQKWPVPGFSAGEDIYFQRYFQPLSQSTSKCFLCLQRDIFPTANVWWWWWCTCSGWKRKTSKRQARGDALWSFIYRENKSIAAFTYLWKKNCERFTNHIDS